MSIEKTVFKGASWLAFFKLISQVFSWAITIVIARILAPDDYGLMAMATMITGYALLFSEMGLGTAIIQKKDVVESALSSIFWFSLMIGIVLTVVCFLFSYVMAYVFNEPRIIPLIKTISIVFIINGLQIVPLNLLKKKFDFKKVGFIEMIGVLISCSCMLLIALIGGGVWTLVFGQIALSVSKLILVFRNVKWRPKLHFDFQGAKSYLAFGGTVTLGRSFFYIFEVSDKFFAGRAWTPQVLGYYTFALQFAQIPTEKIVVLINQVSFPAFSRLQNNKEEFNAFYLNISKVTAALAVPLFFGGFLLGDEIIRLLLTEKWFPMIVLFRYLCLAQIFTAMTSVNSFVHNAQGRPLWGLYYNAVRAAIMIISFYFAVQYGMKAILIPWCTIYILLCTVWTLVTLKKIGISLFVYFKKLLSPLAATLFVALSIQLYNYVVPLVFERGINETVSLTLAISIGVLFYFSYFWAFDRAFLYKLNSFRN